MLQLGMGDALDDWLIQKIQRMRKGSAMASAITRVEQAGILLTSTFKNIITCSDESLIETDTVA